MRLQFLDFFSCFYVGIFSSQRWFHIGGLDSQAKFSSFHVDTGESLYEHQSFVFWFSNTRKMALRFLSDHSGVPFVPSSHPTACGGSFDSYRWCTWLTSMQVIGVPLWWWVSGPSFCIPPLVEEVSFVFFFLAQVLAMEQSCIVRFTSATLRLVSFSLLLSIFAWCFSAVTITSVDKIIGN